MGLQHLSRAAGELAFRSIVKVAPAGAGQMKNGGESEKKNEERVASGRWIEDLRLDESIFEPESASAGNHGDDSLGLALSISIPLVRDPQQFPLRHLNDREHLAAFGDQRFVDRAHDPERAPEPDALQAIEPAFHHEPIAQFRRAPVIDFRPDHHRIFLRLGHLGEAEPEFFGEKGARDFDEAQVGDVMDDGGAVGIEKHHLQLGADARRIFVQHAKPSFRKRSLKQRNCLW